MAWIPVLRELKSDQIIKLTKEYKAMRIDKGFVTTNALYSIKHGSLHKVNINTDLVELGSIGIVLEGKNYTDGTYLVRFYNHIDERHLRDDPKYLLHSLKYSDGQIVKISEKNIFDLAMTWR